MHGLGLWPYAMFIYIMSKTSSPPLLFLANRKALTTFFISCLFTFFHCPTGLAAYIHYCSLYFLFLTVISVQPTLFTENIIAFYDSLVCLIWKITSFNTTCQISFQNIAFTSSSVQLFTKRSHHVSTNDERLNPQHTLGLHLF